MPVEIDIDHVARLARLELTDEEKAEERAKPQQKPAGSAQPAAIDPNQI